MNIENLIFTAVPGLSLVQDLLESLRLGGVVIATALGYGLYRFIKSNRRGQRSSDYDVNLGLDLGDVLIRRGEKSSDHSSSSAPEENKPDVAIPEPEGRFPWLDYPDRGWRVPCPACDEKIMNEYTAFKRHWANNNDCPGPKPVAKETWKDLGLDPSQIQDIKLSFESSNNIDSVTHQETKNSIGESHTGDSYENAAKITDSQFPFIGNERDRMKAECPSCHQMVDNSKSSFLSHWKTNTKCDGPPTDPPSGVSLSLDEWNQLVGQEDEKEGATAKHSDDSPYETDRSPIDSRSIVKKRQAAAKAAIETAVTAKSEENFDTAIEAYTEALSEYQAALDAVNDGAANKGGDIEQAIESTREELDAVKTLRDRNKAYHSAISKLETITEKLDTAAGNRATRTSQTPQAEIATVEELLQEATTTAGKYEFDELAEQLAEQKKQYDKIKENLQSNKPPTTIPAAPQFSLRYDDIEIGEPIGSGGNADVYRATATTNSGEFDLAIKEPRMSGTIDTDAIDQLINEAETWQQLDAHDHIVSVVDYGSTPLPWIGMEYMDGGDLSERTGELSFEQSLWTALAITKGVRYAHKRGVAHLDLKPTNILFQSVEDAWDVPKVADWGLSKHLLEHSQSVEAMSPRYAAPEQLDQNQFGQTDSVTDVYQLGAVLYELFTEEPHFTGSTYEVMNKIQSATPTPPSDRADLPEEIDEIILTALATERADRYDDVLYIRDALQDLWNDRK